MPDQKTPEEKEPRGSFAVLITSGLEIAIGVLIMALLGWWLDKKWNTTPWLTLAGTLFGAGAGLYQFIKTVNTISKDEEKKKEKLQR